MTVIDELVRANAAFAARRPEHQLPMSPARRVAIITCMDARIVPSQAFGLAEGDAHVIRNAGGRAQDALRSLVISQRLLGTNEVAVIHHTDCGMVTFSNDSLRRKVREDLGADADTIDFLPFTDVEQSVRDDVAYLRASPLIPPEVPIRGFVYDVRSGRLTEVDG
ncbi:MAG: beta-class carbonic anhydrase [Gemmatimonadota bacterium]